jgi:hypothetical protein
LPSARTKYSAVRIVTARIRQMGTDFVGIFSRVAFFICGTVALLIGRFYRALEGLGPSLPVRWSQFSTFWTVLGGLGVIVALVPRSWIERICGAAPGQRLSSLPIKMLAGFAAFSYLLTAGLDFAPHGWHPNPQLVFVLCPSCALAMTVDPSLASVLLLLAPLNAAVYGSVGTVAGYLYVILRGPRKDRVLASS